MKPELMWLVWAVALAVVQMLIAVSGAFLQVGLMPLVGNRENFPGEFSRADGLDGTRRPRAPQHAREPGAVCGLDSGFCCDK
jgi:hypothetical protein